MPVGLQRINAAPSSHPTPHIVFIKPLPGPSLPTAHALLCRVAALCHPILAKHHLSVTSLEEFPANREFLGRNFNAGECIQLVLRDRGGAWLPLRHVAMVMVHELAHCMQMNHARAFWAVRGMYAAEMRALWARGYTGEGLWGRGHALNGEETPAAPLCGDDLPEELCGGVYRGRRRKRKRDRLDWREQKERRIRRKFGENGQPLGEDEAARAVMMRGTKGSVYSKPRVAQSQRGRELRAQAALARLGAAPEQRTEAACGSARGGQATLPYKTEPSALVAKTVEATSESEDDGEDGEDADSDAAGPPATDLDGATIRDSEGRDLLRVCPSEGADANAALVKSERDELRDLWRVPPAWPAKTESATEHEAADTASLKKPPRTPDRSSISLTLPPAQHAPSITCPACSLSNDAHDVICAACACVLRRDRNRGHWRCTGKACQGGAYVNSGNSGVCGVCGAVRV